MAKSLHITLQPQRTRTFNGVRIKNKGQQPVDLELEPSHWLTEERDRRGLPVKVEPIETGED